MKVKDTCSTCKHEWESIPLVHFCTLDPVWLQTEGLGVVPLFGRENHWCNYHCKKEE